MASKMNGQQNGWLAGLLLSLTLVFPAAAQVKAGSSTGPVMPAPWTESWRIDRPDVSEGRTEYSTIVFRAGDRVIVDAGGCVASGGVRYRYVDPQFANAPIILPFVDYNQYYGLITIPGATADMVRIATIRGQMLTIPANIPQAALTLGYLDASYSDNRYFSTDSGINNQCASQPDAWVQITILHEYAPPSSASTAFSCGPNLLTYKVTDANGQFGGVRCMQPATSDAGFVWYGEGTWGSFHYRHIGLGVQAPISVRGLSGGNVRGTTGTAITAVSTGGYAVGSAADFYGNGESGAYSANGTLQMTYSGHWPAPTSVHVTGAWNETWTLVREVTYQMLPAVTTCGPQLQKYVVSGNSSAVRCVSRFGGNSDVWYGVRSWSSGVPYAHIGLWEHAPYDATHPLDTGFNWPMNLLVFEFGTASDFCAPAWYGYCGASGKRTIGFSTGSGTISEMGAAYGLWKQSN